MKLRLPGFRGFRERGEQAGAQPPISYAQYYEDLRLAHCFGDRPAGFYLDIGAGHPVHCNVSFLFYLRGWSGITVEPNPWLAQLSEAVRPHDRRVQSLVGASAGEATYHLFEDYHGLSTTDATLAATVEREYGKTARTCTLPVMTLHALCERHAPREIDFLKIDVEGAEREVLQGNDWQRFRPKVVLAEALVPITLAPAWEAWEPILTGNGYRFAHFDKLNRYYVAEEHAHLASRLDPQGFDGVPQIHALPQAALNAAHPDHRLAQLLEGLDMVRLPLLPADAIVERLTAGVPRDALDRRAGSADVEALGQRLFGPVLPPGWPKGLNVGWRVKLRDLYRQVVDTAAFRAACGRISASYAW